LAGRLTNRRARFLDGLPKKLEELFNTSVSPFSGELSAALRHFPLARAASAVYGPTENPPGKIRRRRGVKQFLTKNRVANRRRRVYT
jgi:hypothetical protein